ncbi:MAG: tRNA (adenosine(37)-N6)-dimethylallyltransferase MiaA [Coriobacteriales bacterium]|jgi:tRNA dimethylallyltransferase|nr:tRNA (adenosine(37)-N6)-dimethylallyltransferase MiaA [Coriobacteriales bacterium]
MTKCEKGVIAIVGATGTGKSLLADCLASKINAEIVSADSMQVYKGMDIGTAKVALSERTVVYHCLDLIDVGVSFNAAAYQHVARKAIDDICARGKVAIVCGGTGLYLRAALDDFNLDDGALPVDTALRERLQSQAQMLGAEKFHALLFARDPNSAKLIHPNNIRRVIRAFELLEQGGSYAQQSSGFLAYNSYYDTCYIGLHCERELLYERINKRVDAMIEIGLVDEVRGLLAQGLGKSLTAMQAIGYKEILQYLEGNCDLQMAIERIKQATRRYAKRQDTWFKRDTRIRWLDVTSICYDANNQLVNQLGCQKKDSLVLNKNDDIVAKAMQLLQL